MKQLKKDIKHTDTGDWQRHKRPTEKEPPPQKTEDYDSQKLEFLPRILILNFLVLLQLPN